MKKWVIIGIVVVLIVAGFFALNHEPGKDLGEYGGNIEGYNQNAEAGNAEAGNAGAGYQEDDYEVRVEEGNCPVVFTEYLIDPKYVQKVGQIGVVHGSGKYIVERSYISIKDGFWEQKIPLYAPTDMKLSMGSRYNMNDGKYMDDYALDFDVGCNVKITLGHVKEVVPSIGEQLPVANKDSRSSMLKPIEFKAGELIGYYFQQRGEGAVAGFDFITRDYSFENTFINQERYKDRSSRNLLHGVCPYDFYTGEKKEAYYNLFGSAAGVLFKNKECGNASRDVAGTISGMWFLDKEISGYPFEDEGYKDGDYGSTLPISGDEGQVTIGNLGSSKTLVVYAENPTYKLPWDVTDEHCYQFQNGFAYFKVIDSISMDVYYSASGTCPAVMPSSGAKRYWK